LGDEKGLVWPKEVAPFSYHLVSLGQKGDEIHKAAEELYEAMAKRGMSVLYDDRDLRAGEKFADSDLLGIPERIVVGKEAIASGEFEVVDRKTGSVRRMSEQEILAL
jgi:prolyl-tRNA synthetase